MRSIIDGRAEVHGESGAEKMPRMISRASGMFVDAIRMSDFSNVLSSELLHSHLDISIVLGCPTPSAWSMEPTFYISFGSLVQGLLLECCSFA